MPPWLGVEPDCLLYKNVILHETLATFNKKHGIMFIRFVLNKTYCWVVLNTLLFRHDLPNFFPLRFQLLGQRYVVKESYGGSELGFSYCTWSSWIKNIKRKSQKPYDKKLKINKQMKTSPDLLYLHTGMKSTEALMSIQTGALGGQKPHYEIMYLSWFLVLKSPRLWSSDNPQAIHQ